MLRIVSKLAGEFDGGIPIDAVISEYDAATPNGYRLERSEYMLERLRINGDLVSAGPGLIQRAE